MILWFSLQNAAITGVALFTMSGFKKKRKEKRCFFLCLTSPLPMVSKFVVWNFSMTQGCLETFKSDCRATSKVSDLEGTQWTHSHWTWVDSSWQRCHTLPAKFTCSYSPFPPNWFSLPLSMTSLPQFCLPNLDTKVGNADLCHDFFSSTEVATLPLGCIVLSHEGNAYVYF